MVKLFAIIKKNMKLIVRSKTQALIILFGPLVLTLLVGMAFNNASLYNINIGVYSHEYTELVESFLDKLNEVQFKVLKHDSQQECVDDISEGIVNVCMVFPEGFEVGGHEGSNNEITFYVDPSQINLVYSVIDIISTRVSERREEISSELTAIILNTLESAKTTITNQNPNFVDVIEANEDMQTTEASIKSKLGNLDFDFNEDSFNLERLQDINQDLQSSVIGENGTIIKSINNSLDDLEDIIDYVESHGNDSSLRSDLEDLQDDLDDIKDDLDDLDEEMLTDLASAISSIERELNSTKSKFTDAKNARVDMTRNLNDIDESLKTSLNNVMTIKGALDDIKRDIDNIEITEAGSIVSPITTNIKPVVSQTYLNYMFPALVVLVVMFITLLFSETIVMMEKKSRAYFRNLVTPTRESVFLLATFLTTFILMIIQLVIILGVSTAVFQVDLLANILPTLLIIFMIITLFTTIGILIGLVFSSAETSTLAAVSVGAVSLFISNVILPIESMPFYISQIARFNPFVISESLLRKSILFQTGLESLVMENYASTQIPAILFLLLYIILFFIILVVVQILTKKKMLFKHVLRLAPPKKEQKVIDLSEKDMDPLAKTEALIKEAHEKIKKKDFESARVIYVALNELYTMIPENKKHSYFKKIVDIHKKIEEN